MDCQDDIFYLELVLDNSTNLFDFHTILYAYGSRCAVSPSYFDNYWNSGTINSFSLEIFNVETDQESYFSQHLIV